VATRAEGAGFQLQVTETSTAAALPNDGAGTPISSKQIDEFIERAWTVLTGGFPRTVASRRSVVAPITQGSGSFAITKVSRNSRAHGDASSFPEPSG
jgi:hypothetical protein